MNRGKKKSNIIMTFYTDFITRHHKMKGRVSFQEKNRSLNLLFLENGDIQPLPSRHMHYLAHHFNHATGVKKKKKKRKKEGGK